MTRYSQSFWARSQRFPPILVRLLAKRFERAMTDQDIAKRSGLSLFTVTLLSWATDWSCCDLPTMQRFLVGCGLDFEDRDQRRRACAYLMDNPSWQYLRVSPHWKTLYEPLLKRYRESVLQQIKVTTPTV